MRVLKELCSSVKVILADGGYGRQSLKQSKKKMVEIASIRLLMQYGLIN
jgi:hypothetical protein